MWYIIIGVIIMLIAMTRTDKKERTKKLSTKGGIKQMYPILFGNLLLDEEAYITKETLDTVEITWSNRSSSAKFWIKLAYDNLMITWTFKNKFSKVLNANWTFPKNMDQNKMVEDINAEINYKINKEIHLSDFQNNVESAIFDALNND